MSKQSNLVWIFFVYALFLQQLGGRTLKSLILIPSSESELVYKVHRKSWRRYMHRFQDNFDAFFIQADPQLDQDYLMKGDILYVGGEESICPGVMDKTIQAMEYFLPILDRYDYIIRPNLSSFLVLPRLQNFLKDKPLKKFYAGHTYERGHDRITPLYWVGGACYILSKDLEKLVVENKSFLMHRPKLELNWDDLLLASFLQQQNISPYHHPCYKFEQFHYPHKVFYNIPKDTYHFRIRILERDSKRYKFEKIIHEELYELFYTDVF